MNKSNPAMIQILGSPRSGTNFLQYILAHSFPNLVLVCYGKHFPRKDKLMANLEGGADRALTEEFIDILLTRRDPGQLCVHTSLFTNFSTKDMYLTRSTGASQDVADLVKTAIEAGNINYILNVKHPFATFLSWAKAWKERRKIEQWCEGWKRFHLSWYEFFYDLTNSQTGRSSVIRYEDLLFSTPHAMDHLKQSLCCLKDRDMDIQQAAPKHNMGTGAKQGHGLFIKKQYYWEQQYYDELTIEEMRTIRKIIPGWLFSVFGYTSSRNIARWW